MQALWVLGLLLVLGVALAQNACQTVGSCCTTVQFRNTPSGIALEEGYEVRPNYTSPWGQLLGLAFSLDGANVHPGTHSYLYPVGLLNTSSIPQQADWRGLTWQQTPGGLTPDDLVLTAATSLHTVEGTIIPLKNTWTLHIYWNKAGGACVTSVRLLRTILFSLRMDVRVYYYGGTVLLDQKTFLWSQVQVRTNDINIGTSLSRVDHIAINWTGFGYGALASLSYCLPDTLVDRCGICGGNNQCVPPVVSGQSCINSSFVLPVCRPGHLNAALQCVPDALYRSPELCNGIDDNCNGEIDETFVGQNVTCGVGVCQRTVPECASGAPGLCIPGTGSNETCNGLDDDCDGLVDEDGVCDPPELAGIHVLPLVNCVQRGPPNTGLCYAHFGYRNLDSYHDATLPTGPHSNLVLPAPARTPNIPTVFQRNTTVWDSWSSEGFDCSTGSVMWILGDGQRSVRATAYGSGSRDCTEPQLASLPEPSKPVVPLVDQPCVERTPAGLCLVSLGYYNPNEGQPVQPTSNTVAVGSLPPAEVLDNQLQTLWPGRMRRVTSYEYPCPVGNETLTWTLRTLGTSVTAVAGHVCS